ncbi:MAG: dehydrogenase [bacterium]|nr:dehydrogenase [bacterium]
MTLGYDESLFLLAFDQRSSFSKGLFGASEPLSAEIQRKVSDTKALIFEAFAQALARGAPRRHCGVLVDEQFGSAVARRAKLDGITLAMPVERSGQAEFQFEYGDDFGRHIESFDTDFAKVLVRYNPDGDRELNRRQTRKLAELSDWLHARQRKLLFELLVPATPAQLERCGGQEQYDRTLRATLVVEALRELQGGGVEPDIWKIEGLETSDDCARVVAQARAGTGRQDVACIVLGRGASMERVLQWLATAAPIPGFVGFAVGRTEWNDALARYIAGERSREETRGEIAHRYLRLMRAWGEGTRRGSPGTGVAATPTMTSTTNQPHVVILGGGFGGLQAARTLKHAPARVTLVDSQNHHTFQPLLYQVATAALESPDVAYPLRSLLRRQKNTDVLMVAAETIDPAARVVRLANGRSLAYDYLILATGALSFYFGHPEYRVWAPTLKTLRDAIEIRYRVLTAFERAEQEPDPAEQRALLTFVVVGGGATGVELAGAVAELARHALKRDFRHIDPTQAKVVLVEGGPHILPTYPPVLQDKAAKQLAKIGVEVRTSALVHTVDEFGAVVGDDRIAARTVLWGAGVVAAPIGRSLGAPVDRHGRVEVDFMLHPRGLANVFVIGDAALLIQDGAPVPGVAPAAIQGGRYAARAILKELRGEQVEPFYYRNKGQLATIGRTRAVAMLPGGLKLSGFLAQLMYLFVHLVYLSGFGTRVRVFLSWIWSYLTWARGARLIPSATEVTVALEAEQAAQRPPPSRIEEPPPTPSLH